MRRTGGAKKRKRNEPQPLLGELTAKCLDNVRAQQREGATFSIGDDNDLDPAALVGDPALAALHDAAPTLRSDPSRQLDFDGYALTVLDALFEGRPNAPLQPSGLAAIIRSYVDYAEAIRVHLYTLATRQPRPSVPLAFAASEHLIESFKTSTVFAHIRGAPYTPPGLIFVGHTFAEIALRYIEWTEREQYSHVCGPVDEPSEIIGWLGECKGDTRRRRRRREYGQAGGHDERDLAGIAHQFLRHLFDGAACWLVPCELYGHGPLPPIEAAAATVAPDA